MEKKVSNQRMGEFIDTIVEQTREILSERSDDILRAWDENIEEAQAAEKEKLPPLKLSLSASVDLESEEIETTLRFTAVYTSSTSAKISDPNQTEMDLK